MCVENNVMAYEEFCSGGELFSDSENMYYTCDRQVYLNKSNKDNSSYILGDRGFKITPGKVMYAGEIDGYHTFYATGFHYYSIVYDDGAFSNNDMYSDLTFEGVVVYTGQFSDNILVDQSGRYLINYYNEPGEYIIRQFIGKKVSDVIRVIVVEKTDLSLGVKHVFYNDVDVKYYQSMYDEDAGFAFLFNGGKYGFGEKVIIKVNDCLFEKKFKPDLKLKSQKLQECLILNGSNSVSLTLYDGLERKKDFNYNFKLNSSEMVITLDDSVSKLVTSSRRVLVNSYAGYGNELDESYNLYYWSKSSSDKLTYEDFMSNYSSSEHSGSYSQNNGVILRDSDGVYYLYVLAKDTLGNSLVVRSEEYVLKRHQILNKATSGDFILVLVLCFGAAAPVFIYLFIRGKDTE